MQDSYCNVDPLDNGQRRLLFDHSNKWNAIKNNRDSLKDIINFVLYNHRYILKSKQMSAHSDGYRLMWISNEFLAYEYNREDVKIYFRNIFETTYII